MTRTQAFAAGTILLGAALGAAAQNPQNPPFRLFGAGGQPPAAAQPKVQPQIPPGGPWGRPPVNLKPLNPGGATDSAQTSAAYWTDRLISELDQLKSEVTTARIPPGQRAAVIDRANAAIERAVGLTKALAQNNRVMWYRANGEIDAALADLVKAVPPQLASDPGFSRLLSRVNYANLQIGAALVSGDNAADQQKRWLLRLATALEENAERLRAEADEHLGVRGLGAALQREIQQFTRAAQAFNKDLQTTGNVDRARKEFAVVGSQWMDVSDALGRLPNAPADVRYQVGRVDGVYRKLADMLAVNPPINPRPPINPNPPRPQRLSILAVGADAGMEPRVVVFTDTKGTVAHTFLAYGRVVHRTGVRVSVADLNGDGMPEVVTTLGGNGPPRVKVFDGRDMSMMLYFDAFDAKVATYGFNVAAHDLTADGRALIAVAPDTGGPPVVQVYDLAQGKLVATVQAYPPKFSGGVRLAWGDIDGDGSPDLITASGPGELASVVKVFNGRNFNQVISTFPGVDDKYRGGLWVAAADLTQNNQAEIVVGLDAGSRPVVRIFDGRKGQFLGDFEPFPSTFRGGVRVALGDPDESARTRIVCSPGPGSPRGSPVKVFSLRRELVADLTPFGDFTGGAFVGTR